MGKSDKGNLAILLDSCPLSWSSMEEFHFRLAEALCAMGVLPVIVFANEIPSGIRARMESSGAVVAWLNYNLSLRDYYAGLHGLVQKYDVRLVQIRHFNYFRALPWLVRFSGVRRIVFTEGNSGEFLPNPWTRPVLRFRTWVVTWPITQVVALSGFVKEQLIRAGVAGGRIQVIHNGVDLEHYTPNARAREQVRRELGVGPEDTVLTTVSFLLRWKHPEVLVQSCALLLQRGLPVHLVFGGDGEMREELRELGRSLGIESRLHFLGHCADPARILQAGDIFVLASLHEACAKAFLEAMACGLPVVASRSGGNAELIEDGRTGVLARPLDAAAFADATGKLVANRDLRLQMGASALERARERFALDIPVARYLRLYEALWNG